MTVVVVVVVMVLICETRYSCLVGGLWLRHLSRGCPPRRGGSAHS